MIFCLWKKMNKNKHIVLQFNVMGKILHYFYRSEIPNCFRRAEFGFLMLNVLIILTMFKIIFYKKRSFFYLFAKAGKLWNCCFCINFLLEFVIFLIFRKIL